MGSIGSESEDWFLCSISSLIAACLRSLYKSVGSNGMAAAASSSKVSEMIGRVSGSLPDAALVIAGGIGVPAKVDD